MTERVYTVWMRLKEAVRNGDGRVCHHSPTHVCALNERTNSKILSCLLLTMHIFMSVTDFSETGNGYARDACVMLPTLKRCACPDLSSTTWLCLGSENSKHILSAVSCEGAKH